jgi:hypothetical protein
MSKRNQPLYMGTTEISTERSAGEITSLLIRVGANQIATDYHGGKIAGLRFSLSVDGQDILFSLPARTEPVFKYLMKHKPHSVYSRSTSEEHEARLKEDAERIGWRQLFRWVEAQVALMDLGMVKCQEVFFPYLTMDATGQTLYEKFEANGMRLLEAPKKQ